MRVIQQKTRKPKLFKKSCMYKGGITPFYRAMFKLSCGQIRDLLLKFSINIEEMEVLK